MDGERVVVCDEAKNHQSIPHRTNGDKIQFVKWETSSRGVCANMGKIDRAHL